MLGGALGELGVGGDPAARSGASGAARITTQCRSFQVRWRLRRGSASPGHRGGAGRGRALRARRFGFGGFSGLTGFGDFATFG